MSDKKLSADAYKGVRDFYPEDMAIQRYIFDTWAKTAESFGFERYDASILEPSDLYKAKGAENEEMVNEQTYTFIDRGEREVTLRPEMTPTVARMVAARRRELAFPLRWYSIPNLFRYERPQRGRLREHWQFNCDIFGADDVAADVEVIALAYQIMIDFGATPEMFEIRVNDRALMNEWYNLMGVSEAGTCSLLTKLNDRKNKISPSEYKSELRSILAEPFDIDTLQIGLESGDINQLRPDVDLRRIIEGLAELGIKNVSLDKTLARGFDYYTSTIFEVFDTSPHNNRSMMGGGRYDKLTALFSDDAISGIGFGVGDVIMRDFLETHNLIPDQIRSTAPKVMIIPMEAEQNLYAEQVAALIRQAGHKVATDIGTRKIGKKIGSASDWGCQFVIVIGEQEATTGELTLKYLATGETKVGPISALVAELT